MEKFENVVSELNNELRDLRIEIAKLVRFQKMKKLLEVTIAFASIILIGVFFAKFKENFILSLVIIVALIIVFKVFKWEKNDSYISNLFFTSDDEIKYAKMVLVNRIDFIIDIFELFEKGELKESDLTDTRQYILTGNTKLKKRK